MPTSQPSNPPASGGASRLILFATVFFDLLGFGIVIPFLPMYAERLGIGAGAIGLLLSAYSITQFIFAPLLGRLSDRIGRRPIIMLGLLGSSLSYLIYGFTDSFAGLLISRAVHGACAATISTAQAYIADTTEESKRAQAMGMIGAAFGLGFVLGPAVGGLPDHLRDRGAGGDLRADRACGVRLRGGRRRRIAGLRRIDAGDRAGLPGRQTGAVHRRARAGGGRRGCPRGRSCAVGKLAVARRAL